MACSSPPTSTSAYSFAANVSIPGPRMSSPITPSPHSPTYCSSSNPLYSPASSCFNRSNVPSPVPSPSSSTCSAAPSLIPSYDILPAIDASGRYVVTGTLQQSLFGVVKLGFDRHRRCQIAIKVSRRERAAIQQTRSGIQVLENVKREAALMRYINERSNKTHNNSSSATNSSSCSSSASPISSSHPPLHPLHHSSSSLYNPCYSSSVSSHHPFRPLRRCSKMSSRVWKCEQSELIKKSLRNLQQNDIKNSDNNDILESKQQSNHNNVENALNEKQTSCNQMSDSTRECTETSKTSFSTASTDNEDDSINSHSDEEHEICQSQQQTQLQQNNQTTNKQSNPTTNNNSNRIFDTCDVQGEQHICHYIDEMEDEYFHYLISEFVCAGDLYAMLASFPSHRIDEEEAKRLFREIILAVRYLHTRNIAHCDLSLENLCLDENHNVKLIDYGVSAIHPFLPMSYETASQYFVYKPSVNISSQQTFPNHQQPLNNSNITKSISVSDELNSINSSRFAEIASFSSKISRSICPLPVNSVLTHFLCRRVDQIVDKPGKLRYMSHELYAGQEWDAYANDIFSCGVILYSLLTGRPPFSSADHSDVWFNVIWSGQWLTAPIMSQSSAHVYTHLSVEALDLINKMIKPQRQRPTADQILNHSWLTNSNNEKSST